MYLLTWDELARTSPSNGPLCLMLRELWYKTVTLLCLWPTFSLRHDQCCTTNLVFLNQLHRRTTLRLFSHQSENDWEQEKITDILPSNYRVPIFSEVGPGRWQWADSIMLNRGEPGKGPLRHRRQRVGRSGLVMFSKRQHGASSRNNLFHKINVRIF